LTNRPVLRRGLFGGTFDPPHNAHVALATAALAALQLDQVRWVPTGNPWQKSRAITPAAHREAMVRAAIAHEPRFVLDRTEIEREGASYTIDTVRALQAAHPGVQWVLLIGQDQYAGLHTWRDWPALLAQVELAVAQRPGQPWRPNAEVQRVPHRAVPLPPMPVAATDIRARVAAGQGIAALVPPGVARYIESHGLYRSPDRS
jgi:nicotinate-nucleotide adenylyltransferase